MLTWLCAGMAWLCAGMVGADVVVCGNSGSTECCCLARARTSFRSILLHPVVLCCIVSHCAEGEFGIGCWGVLQLGVG